MAIGCPYLFDPQSRIPAAHEHGVFWDAFPAFALRAPPAATQACWLKKSAYFSFLKSRQVSIATVAVLGSNRKRAHAGPEPALPHWHLGPRLVVVRKNPAYRLRRASFWQRNIVSLNRMPGLRQPKAEHAGYPSNREEARVIGVFRCHPPLQNASNTSANASGMRLAQAMKRTANSFLRAPSSGRSWPQRKNN
jgi:hypothetical protein